MERLGPLSYLQVETSDKQCWRRHVDHLKELISRERPHETLPDTAPAGHSDSGREDCELCVPVSNSTPMSPDPNLDPNSDPDSYLVVDEQSQPPTPVVPIQPPVESGKQYPTQ